MNEYQDLPKSINIKGTAYWEDKRRVEGGVVYAFTDDDTTKSFQEPVDNDGDYEIKGLEEGNWTLVAFHADARPVTKKVRIKASDKGELPVVGITDIEEKEIPVRKDKEGVLRANIDFFVHSLSDSTDPGMGRIFFTVLCVLFVSALCVYVGLHWKFQHPPAKAPVSQAILGLVTSTKTTLQKEPLQIKELSSLIEEMKKVMEVAPHSSRALLIPVYGQVEFWLYRLEELVRDFIDSTKNSANSSEDSPKKSDIEKATKFLQDRITELESQEKGLDKNSPTFFFWTSGSFRWAEVAFWAMFGILAQLILTTGGYLRKNRFYRSGIWLHLSLLFTVPLLTMVFVFLLSMLKLELPTGGGNSVALDLANPLILAAISFVLAAVPWGLWNRLRATGTQLTGAVDKNF